MGHFLLIILFVRAYAEHDAISVDSVLVKEVSSVNFHKDSNSDDRDTKSLQLEFEHLQNYLAERIGSTENVLIERSTVVQGFVGLSTNSVIGLIVGSFAIVIGLMLMAVEHSKTALQKPLGFHQTGAVVLGSLVAVGGLITFIVSIGSNNNGPSLLTFDLIRSSVVIFVAANLSAAAGTGGGGLYTAIFLAIPKMTAHQAMPLSYITVFGVACGSFAFLVQSRHPHAKRPLIDYLLCLIIEPFTLLGAMFGVFLNVTFPSFIIVILLALVLGISAWRTIVKGIQLNAKEISERASVPLQRIAESEGRFPVISNAEEASEFLPADVQEMLEQESRFPWGYFVELFVIWSVLSLLFVLRGGDSSHSSIVGIQCGSTMYWVIVSGTVLFLVLSTGLVLSYTHKLYQKKRFLRYPYLSSDLNWPRKDLIIWPLVSIGVGVAAGFVGISGGMLQAPLLLEMGVLPQVTAATTSFMVLFTSASVSVQYLLLQLLDWRLALWHWALGLVAAFIGQTALDALMKRYQRQSLIAFLLAGLIIICGLTSLIFEGTKLIQGQVKMSFGTPCSPAA